MCDQVQKKERKKKTFELFSKFSSVQKISQWCVVYYYTHAIQPNGSWTSWVEDQYMTTRRE